MENASASEANTIIIAYEKDAENILALLSIRELLDANADTTTHIIVRINQKENINKAKAHGANQVISPLVMAADEIIKKLVADDRLNFNIFT